MAALVLFALLSAASCYNLDTSNPIVYDDVTRNTSQRASYFGYSVLLNNRYSSGQVPRLLIGAPRSNSTHFDPNEVLEPGAVYSCPYMGPCAELRLDYTGNEQPPSQKHKSTSNNIWDLKNHSWIGGAMDSERQEGGRIVICAPRWINQYYVKEDPSKDYHMNGLCYSMFNDQLDPNVPATRLVPTGDHLDQFYRPNGRKEVLYFAQSQAGLSVHLMPGNKDAGMLIGAPGLLEWSGGMVEYLDRIETEREGRNKRSTSQQRKLFDVSRVLNPFYTREEGDGDDYLGYQVSSGRFFNKSEQLYVASAPRGSNFTGYVKVVQFPTKVKRNSKWKIYDKKQGQEVGEYFGSSIAVGDFTGDGYDDLVVGAPLYSDRARRREVGRIHVFLGAPDDKLQRPFSGALIEGYSVGGRFGSAVAALGDIDQDGYDDVAVGAPYEDDHRGAVYIYNGGPGGLKAELSQRISASDVHHSLRGFGISISPPDDMDDNHYNDVAVGSFLSGHVVLFRSSPVVTLNLTVTPSVELLFNGTSVFDVTICQTYTGSNAPHSINVTRGLKVDELYNRVKYNASEKQVTLLRAQPLCETVPVQHKYDEERLESVKITAYQDIARSRLQTNRSLIWITADSDPSGNDTFCKDCPVVDEDKFQREATVDLEYARECNPCRCDLNLTCDLLVNQTSLNGEFVLGSSRTVRLMMNVTNRGDVSYGTFITVNLHKNVNIFNLPTSCQDEPQGVLLKVVCRFKKPVRQGDVNSMSLDLDVSYIDELADPQTGAISDIVLRVEVDTRSEEFHREDNVVFPTLKIRTEADLVIRGQSKEELYTYIKKEDEEDEDTPIKIAFVQNYQVIKIGSSPVQKMYIQFLVPVLWSVGDIKFLSMYRPEGKVGDQSLTCTSDFNFLRRNTKLQRLEEGKDELEDIDRVKRSMAGVEMKSHVDEYPSNRSLYLNCTTPEVGCFTIHCVATHFKQNSLEVELAMFLNIKALEPLMEDKDIVHVSTSASVSIVKPIDIKHSDSHGPDHIVVPSTFVGSLPKKRVQIWIIVLAVIGGILLLLLVILALVKAGFFRRKKKEKLVALKKADRGIETHIGPHRSSIEPLY